MSGRRLLEGVSAPRAPERLRARALTAARAELAGTVRTTLVDRLWGSRTLRWAWAAACLLLVLGHLTAGSGAPALPTSPPRTTVVAAGDPLLERLLAARGDLAGSRTREESRRVAEILEIELS